MTDAAPDYDIDSILEAVDETGLLFAGTGELELLKESVGSVIVVDTIMFAYTQLSDRVVANGKPRRYRFRSRLVSSLYTEKNTRGRFVFEDGTVVYYDRSVLD